MYILDIGFAYYSSRQTEAGGTARPPVLLYYVGIEKGENSEIGIDYGQPPVGPKRMHVLGIEKGERRKERGKRKKGENIRFSERYYNQCELYLCLVTKRMWEYEKGERCELNLCLMTEKLHGYPYLFLCAKVHAYRERGEIPILD